MTTNLFDIVSGSTDLIFPDESVGTYSLATHEVHEAEELREKLNSDIPEYGRWLSVIDERDVERYLVAPGDLLKALKDAEVTLSERFTIESMSKSGSEQSAPYHVEVTFPDRRESAQSESQAALSDD
jgi:hypothetical protein